MTILRFLALSALFAPLAAGAEEPAGDRQSTDRSRETAITVLATGSSQSLNRTSQSVSIIGRDEIDSLQGADIARVLERLPGISLARNGSLGGFTGLFLRGANSQQVLVVVDGIRLADAAAPGGGFDFGSLMTGPIGKIELLRGSNSVVWGSDAMGGVIAMSSREVNGLDARVEYGARDTLDAELSAGLQRASYGITLSGGHTTSDGFSSAVSGTERDGFRQWRIGGRGHLDLAGGFALVAAARYADSRTEFDGFSFSPPFGLIDTPELTLTEEISARAGLEYRGSALEVAAGYAIYDIDRTNFDPRFGSAPSFASDGRQQRLEMKGSWNAAGSLRLHFGAEHEWARYSTTFDARKAAQTTSGHALLEWSGQGVNLAAGLRIDDHSGFGSEISFGANGSVAIVDGWRVRASFGEGFKAPSLFQLYSNFGNAALRPERSRSYDLALETGDRNGSLHAALTLFRRDTENLIDFVSCFGIIGGICTNRPFGTYDNVGKARAEGAEVELAAAITENLRMQAAYTWLRARDRTAGSPNRGNDLARRPRHALSLSVDWTTPLAGLKLGGDLRIVGRSFDDRGNFVRLGGYAIATLRAALPLSETVELFGRIENIGDEQYQTVAGYGTPGRSAFFGARARF
ncbi:MAG: TonB-dependent receptor [Novosphingobium sp.]|nr:TonB-dependent receptor [Novosphingobium sp.]